MQSKGQWNTTRSLIPKLNVDKPKGAPRRLKNDYTVSDCPHHFVWCPCNIPSVKEEITKREREQEEQYAPF